MTTRKPPDRGTPIITKPPSISEEAFSQQVIDLARYCGWRVAHFRPARLTDKDGKERWRTPVAADGQGLPDLILVNRGNAHNLGRVIFAELKIESNDLTSSQRIWIDSLRACPGVKVYVWRPSNWELIKATLEGKE